MLLTRRPTTPNGIRPTSSRSKCSRSPFLALLCLPLLLNGPLAGTAMASQPVERQGAGASPTRAADQRAADTGIGASPATPTPADMPTPADTARRVIESRGWHFPDELDAMDPHVRLLLLAPRGPLLVQATLTIDGQPYASHREQMVGGLLREGDLDQDGQPTWKEMAQLRQLGRFRSYFNRTPVLFDLNSDGIAQAREVRYLFAYTTGGTALNLPATYSPAGEPVLVQLLDRDGDRGLNAAELDDASRQLTSLDADDNELLDAREIQGNNPYGFVSRSDIARESAIRHLTAATDWGALRDELQRRYAGERPLEASFFSHTPRLFERLDADGDGRLIPEELASLRTLPPHLHLEFPLGKSATDGDAVRLVKASPDLALSDRAVSDGGRQILLAFDQVLVRVEAVAAPDYSNNYQTQSERIMKSLDKDANGYVDRQEVSGQRGYAAQFDQWDLDSDGKVFAKEIEGYYAEQMASRLGSVALAAAEQPLPLLALVDSNSNGSLGLREVREAAERLRRLDTNRDGTVGAGEIPRTFHFSVGRGPSVTSPSLRRFLGGFGAATSRPGDSASSPPAWFLATDRNGDGDISRREFLGSDAQFAELDRNGDQLIEPSEVASSEDSSGQ